MSQALPTNSDEESKTALLSQDQKSRLQELLTKYAASLMGDALRGLHESVEETMRASAFLIMLSDHFGSDAKILNDHITSFNRKTSALHDILKDALSEKASIGFSQVLLRSIARLVKFLTTKYPIAPAPWADNPAADGGLESQPEGKSWSVVNEGRMTKMFRAMSDVWVQTNSVLTSENYNDLAKTIAKIQRGKKPQNAGRPEDVKLTWLISDCVQAGIPLDVLAEALVDNDLGLERSRHTRKQQIRAETTRLEQALKRSQSRHHK